jgi:hypothetical protein
MGADRRYPCAGRRGGQPPWRRSLAAHLHQPAAGAVQPVADTVRVSDADSHPLHFRVIIADQPAADFGATHVPTALTSLGRAWGLPASPVVRMPEYNNSGHGDVPR